MDEFLRGLSPEDAIAAINDQMVFGTAMVHEVNGIKRRIPPTEWMLIDTDEGTRVLPIEFAKHTVDYANPMQMEG